MSYLPVLSAHCVCASIWDKLYWLYVSVSFFSSLCLHQPAPVCSDLQFSEESHNFKLCVCIWDLEKLNGFMWKECCPPSHPCLSFSSFLSLLHFSLNSSIAASFNILPVIYFSPHLGIVQSDNIILNVPLLWSQFISILPTPWIIKSIWPSSVRWQLVLHLNQIKEIWRVSFQMIVPSFKTDKALTHILQTQ